MLKKYIIRLYSQHKIYTLLGGDERPLNISEAALIIWTNPELTKNLIKF